MYIYLYIAPEFYFFTLSEVSCTKVILLCMHIRQDHSTRGLAITLHAIDSLHTFVIVTVVCVKIM